MKKMLIGLAAVLASGSVVLAAADSRDFTCNVTSISTGTASYVVRGDIEAVRVIVPTGGTGTVTLATANETVFTKADITASTTFYPRLKVNTSAGGTNLVEAVTDKYVSAGTLTATVVNSATTLTNQNYTIRVIFNK
jgi:hypothetical protein